MPRLVCVKCKTELKPIENGVSSVEMADFGAYKLWNSDKWGCPECGFEVLAGFAQEPMAGHYEPGFQAKLAARPDAIGWK